MGQPDAAQALALHQVQEVTRVTTLSLDYDNSDYGLRLATTGAIDVDTRELLAAAVSSAVTSGNYPRIVVDLGQVTFLDFTGIAVLLAGQNLAAEHGIAYSVINLTDMVRGSVDITDVIEALVTLPGHHLRAP